ncbi:MAG: hypothetical protein R3C18_10140 [Planctomycetaceae bacterium]
MNTRLSMLDIDGMQLRNRESIDWLTLKVRLRINGQLALSTNERKEQLEATSRRTDD